MRYIATSNLSGSIEIFLPYLQEAEAYYRYEMLQLESFLVLLSFKNLTKFENSVREYEIEIERDKEKRKRKRKEKREREKRKEKEKREKDTTFRFRESDGSNFFQKTCLQKELCTERVCPSQPYWTFEMAPKFALDVPYNKSESNVNSREDSPASSCSYKTTDNVGVTSVDKLDETDSIEQCQQKCDMNREFVCRSLEFQKSGQFRNKCFLSGDNTETLGGFRTQKLNVVYKERECVTESCVNGIYTFEKMTGVVLRLASVQRELQVSDDRAAKSGYCLQQCRLDGVKCPAVHFSYRDRTCAILDQNSQGRDENLLNNNQAVSFFEKICLRGTSAQQNCRNKDWAFERIIGYQLSSDSYFTSRNSIQNRRDCEEICLSSPTCKSALYESDTLVCKLSEYTRRTRSNKFDLVPDPRRAKINYLENACVPQSTRCSYTNFRDSTAVFADFEANNYRNEDECKNLCDSSASFVCRAYAYSSFLSRCTLSGDDDISARQQDRADKAGTVYMRKACTDSGTRTSTAPPSEDCMNGLSIYEKMTATILNTATTISQSRIPENEDSKTEYCLRQCTESGKSCPAVHYSYADLSCRILDQNSEGRGLRLIRANEVNYFEKVCLQGLTARSLCQGRTWAFQRVVGYQLRSNLYYKTETRVQTRQDCEVKCLESSSCKSALYESDTKDCKLSAYTRRSNPSDYNPTSNVRTSYISYLENGCVSAPPTCSYNKLIDSQTSYQDKISQNVFSEDECKRNCEASRSFFCRSYSYQVSQKICMLSSDDAITTGNSANKPQFGVIYVERTCTRPVTSTTSSPTGSKCESGQLSLIEKTMGYTVDTRFENDLYVGNPGSPGITAVCKIRCGDTDGCDAFIVYYEDRPRCSYVTRSGADSSILVQRRRTSFFANICVPAADISSNCDSRLWAFQRFPSSRLFNFQIKGTYADLTRAECEAKCLTAESFICRSMLYNRLDKSCQLSDENRRTLRQFNLLPDQSVEYIENNCHRDRFNCRYIPERRSTFMTYSTKSIQRIQYAQCLQECDKEPTFDCLSISYVEDIFGQGNCILNSEDVQTAGEFSLQLRAGSTYNGKICDSVIPVTTTARPIQCEPGQYSFEKLTGYDVSEAHQEMNAIIDVKDLTTSCAKECLRLESICDAFVIDYSRKMCFSIKTREQLFPNSNYFSQNLDISYFKKICLPDNPCSTKTWAFDRVLDFFLTDNVAKELNNVGSRVECERACQREIEFKCASANYFNNEKICQLSAESRRTQPGSFSERRSVDYLDNHCAEDPPSCKYQSREEKFLPFTDKSLKGSSEEQCKLSCETEPELPCRSYNWDKVRGECYLSSDDTWSRPEGEQALLSGFNYANYVYGEKGRCEQVRVACDEEAMVISLSFSQTFNGVVYARSKAKECSVPVNGESQTTLTLPLGIECGTIAESKVRYVNEVIVQKHPIIQTINDKHIKVVCTFDKAEQVHKLWLLEVWVEKGIFKSRKYNLEFYIQFKNLDGDMMTLIDINGCPPEASIFPALQYDPRDGKSQFATFKAFRFRTSGYITFKAQITFCQDSCKPVTCRDNMESVGRKRRDFPTELFVDDSESEFGSGDEDLPETTDLVENAIGTTPELIPTEEHELNYNTETSTEWQNSEDDVEEAGYMVVPDATNDESDDSSGNDLSETSITSETPNSSTTGGYEELDNEHTTQETVQPTTLFKSSKIPSTTRITTSFPTVRKTKPKTIPTIPTRTPTYSNHRNPYESGYQRDSKQHIYNSPRQEYDYPSNKRRPVIMPSDTPLKYSLLVSPDKNDYLAEDRAEGAAHTGISPKRDYSETFTLYENDKICSDRTTVIVSITTVIILHLIIIVSGLIYYRYRKKRRNKNLDYEYTAGPPLPKRNNQSAGNSGILARPNMTFRNIYGYTTAPTSSTASTSSAAAT
ncbi:hypothetical protein GQR58_009584 [Nymphon striatum]|nr:hypothetical protein GQR58_009584 [Nymphon striatum]